MSESKKPIALIDLDANKIVEVNKWKLQQENVLKENPFVEIKDVATYNQARKNRTALVSARTAIEKQDKVIAEKIKNLRSGTIEIKDQLISITKPSEEKQQEEVKRWETEKEEERLEKVRIEQRRIDSIKNDIEEIISKESSAINELKFERIEAFRTELIENFKILNTKNFEEFVSLFEEKKEVLFKDLEIKILRLQEDEQRRIDKEEIEVEKKRLEEIKAQQETAAAKIKADQEAAQKKLNEEREKQETERHRIQKIEEARLAKIKSDQEAESLRIKKEQEAAQIKIDKERADLDAKLADLKAKEADRLAKAESDLKAKEAADLKIIQDAAEKRRLEELKPDKQKIHEFLVKLDSSIVLPEIKDQALKTDLQTFKTHMHDRLEKFKTHFKNFK